MGNKPSLGFFRIKCKKTTSKICNKITIILTLLKSLNFGLGFYSTIANQIKHLSKHQKLSKTDACHAKQSCSANNSKINFNVYSRTSSAFFYVKLYLDKNYILIKYK